MSVPFPLQTHLFRAKQRGPTTSVHLALFFLSPILWYRCQLSFSSSSRSVVIPEVCLGREKGGTGPYGPDDSAEVDAAGWSQTLRCMTVRTGLREWKTQVEKRWYWKLLLRQSCQWCTVHKVLFISFIILPKNVKSCEWYGKNGRSTGFVMSSYWDTKDKNK